MDSFERLPAQMNSVACMCARPRANEQRQRHQGMPQTAMSAAMQRCPCTGNSCTACTEQRLKCPPVGLQLSSPPTPMWRWSRCTQLKPEGCSTKVEGRTAEGERHSTTLGASQRAAVQEGRRHTQHAWREGAASKHGYMALVARPQQHPSTQPSLLVSPAAHGRAWPTQMQPR